MLNTVNLLSVLTLDMPQAAELLEAEQPELDNVSAHVEQTISELSISTCRVTVPRYEAIFGLEPSGTLAERIAALIIQLNSRPPATKKYLEELLTAVTGCRCRIEEYYSQYRFRVYIKSVEVIPDMEKTAAFVRLLKPAHLSAALCLQRQTQGRVILPCRAMIGRAIRVRPYQPQNISLAAGLHTSFFTRIGRRIQIQPKGV